MKIYKYIFVLIISSLIVGVLGFASDIYHDFKSMSKKSRRSALIDLRIYRDEILQILVVDYLEKGNSLRISESLAQVDFDRVICELEKIDNPNTKCKECRRSISVEISDIK